MMFCISLWVVALVLSLSVTPARAESGTDAVAAAEAVEMGTDPRDFAPKFMPYYRYTELENDLKQHELVAFGLLAFTKKFAMTYEFPLAKEVDIKDTDFFKAGLPRSPAGGVVLPSGIPAEGDGEETGVGDGNVRFFYRLGSALGGDWLAGAQINLPTASDDLLGAEQLQLAPMLTWIYDLPFWPAPGSFFAGMNFYFFDVFGESSAEDVSQYVGRWFLMFPLTPPDKPVIGGMYLLPEFQPVYDFEQDHFSFWAAPEVGKMLSPGNIVYVKPGWGVSPDEVDRKFTIEVGWRWFF
jgi:hypothetical protein